MKRSIIATLIVFLGLSALQVQAQSLDDVLKSHFEAVGQKKLVKIDNMKTTGSINQQGMDIPFEQYISRPGKMRVVGTFMGLQFIQTYNGTEGWTLNPFSGSTDPQPFTADELKGIKLQADLDGMLWNWKDKGYTVTLDGNEEVEGTPCYKIKVITDTKDEFTYFIDEESYVMIRSTSKMTIMENEVETDTYYSNYKQFDGIAIPCNITNKYNGTTGEVITVSNVEMNVDMPNMLFEKPVAETTNDSGTKE